MKVSIICTNYNKGDWISEAIESFLKQETDFPYEIILVDDASTDHSPQLIRDYQNQYPELIRSFFNETNQGIARTWKSICHKARGKYIARCDGDDFWTDAKKLQKQVDLLESHLSSKWSNTDFDLVDSEGQVFQADTLANNALPFIDSFEKMLALKGMTMSSTWLVDRELMLEVNEQLDDDATDDTFDLQLELFQRTSLTFLPESTTVYRVIEESDSRSKSSEKLEKRLRGIYATQCHYMDKNVQADIREICRLQAEHDIQQDLRSFNAEQEVKRLEKERISLLARNEELVGQIREQVLEQEALTVQYDQLLAKYDRSVDQYGQLLHQYNSVVTSRRWTIPTRIINALPFRKGTSSEKENKMVVDKLLRTYREQGLRATVRKSKEHLHRLAAGGQDGQAAVHHKIDLTKIPVMPQWDDVIAADYLNQPYQKPARLAKEKLDIAWVSPPVGPGGGGHTTISRFVKFLQEQGHSVTFYIYNNNTMAQSAKEAQDIFRLSYGIDVAVADLDNFGDHDVVFATSWETAYPVFNLKKKNLHKFYFVQDFEPIFYGVGSRYMLAEATYKFGFYGITAGKWLTQKVSQYGMDADYFDFGADSEIYRPKGQVIKEKKIAFYARAHTERRGFELGIMALKIFKDRHPDYTIEFFGQDMSGYDIPFDFIDRGILNKEELAKIYHESVACLVLSLTNVSLLPLELLVAGCVPVMNTGDNNSMVLGDLEDIAYAEAYPTALADQLCRAVERDDVNAYAQAMSDKYHTLSWEESYRKVEHIIKREVCDGN